MTKTVCLRRKGPESRGSCEPVQVGPGRISLQQYRTEIIKVGFGGSTHVTGGAYEDVGLLVYDESRLE